MFAAKTYHVREGFTRVVSESSMLKIALRSFGAIALATASIAATASTTLVLQDGVAGYTGTRDVDLFQGAPDVNGGLIDDISIDANDDGFIRQGLISFTDLIGSGSNQILLGSTIFSAQIELRINSSGSGIIGHRMTTAWDELSVTWNSLGGGIIPGTNAAATPTFQLGSNDGNANIANNIWITLDVTADLQAIVNGADNFGWGLVPFVPNGTNGVDFWSREYAVNPAFRPILRVNYEPIPEPATMTVIALAALAAAAKRRKKA